MHKMTYTTSKEVLVGGDEELLLTVNFRPSSVGCIDATIRIRLIDTAIRYSVSLDTNLFSFLRFIQYFRL